MKKYINSAFLYSILAMCGGVFYREFTKFQGFTGSTTLSVVHTHYFALGMIMFLLLAVLEKQLSFSNQKFGKSSFVLYHIGINMTAVLLFVRGFFQVINPQLALSADKAISGMAGLGHLILGTGIILTFLALKKSVALQEK